MPDMNKHPECYVCGTLAPLPLKGYYKRHGLVKCQNCGFVFMEQIPTPAALQEHYGMYSYGVNEYVSPITLKSFNLLLDEFEKYRKTNRILDVGCGRGLFLMEAHKRGWEAYGTEFSDKAVSICRQGGIRMVKGGLDVNRFEQRDFDVITSFEVFEHMNTPHQELQSMHQLLRENGLFYCTTPNFNSLLRYYLKADYNIIGYPEHLSYYTRSTLNRVVLKNGFRMREFRSTGISITRINTSIKESTEKFVEETNADEVLRRNIDKKWYLGLLKKAANWLLTLTNTGLTLKGYYVKKPTTQR